MALFLHEIGFCDYLPSHIDAGARICHAPLKYGDGAPMLGIMTLILSFSPVNRYCEYFSPTACFPGFWADHGSRFAANASCSHACSGSCRAPAATSLTKSLRVMVVINFSYMMISPFVDTGFFYRIPLFLTQTALAHKQKACQGNKIVEDGLLAAIGLYCGQTFSQLRSEAMKAICAIVTVMMLVDHSIVFMASERAGRRPDIQRQMRLLSRS